MKTKLTTLQKIFVLCITFLLLPVLSLNASDKVKCSEIQIANLVSCIKTGNEGTRKCAIYLAGKYKIEEAADVLVEVLEDEKDPSVILLTAFALYRIDEQRALFTVLDLAIELSDEDLSEMLVKTAVEFAKN